jgi:hypothetical protein
MKIHYDVRKITIRIRLVALQKVRIWVMVRVMVGFFLKTLVSYFNGSEFHAGSLLTANDLPPSVVSQRKYIQRVHSSQNKSHARLTILRMRNLPASTVKFFYKEIDATF